MRTLEQCKQEAERLYPARAIRELGEVISVDKSHMGAFIQGAEYALKVHWIPIEQMPVSRPNDSHKIYCWLKNKDNNVILFVLWEGNTCNHYRDSFTPTHYAIIQIPKP